MQVWPAIDVRGGKCVRLRQGDYKQETVFDEDPVSVAARWVNQGAECLHLVDLDGARDGYAVNREVIRAIVESTSVPCELGGGIRDADTVRDWLDVGLQRLVVGTRALQDVAWFRQMTDEFPGHLVLGIDARDGQVATDGWLKTSDTSAVEFARQLCAEPIAAIVYTDISQDGMMAGPNIPAMAEMKAAVSCPVIASGGVTSAADVSRLAEVGMDGCIIGRSLYEGRLSIADALAAVRASRNQAGGDMRG